MSVKTFGIPFYFGSKSKMIIPDSLRQKVPDLTGSGSTTLQKAKIFIFSKLRHGFTYVDTAGPL